MNRLCLQFKTICLNRFENPRDSSDLRPFIDLSGKFAHTRFENTYITKLVCCRPCAADVFGWLRYCVRRNGIPILSYLRRVLLWLPLDKKESRTVDVLRRYLVYRAPRSLLVNLVTILLAFEISSTFFYSSSPNSCVVTGVETAHSD